MYFNNIFSKKYQQRVQKNILINFKIKLFNKRKKNQNIKVRSPKLMKFQNFQNSIVCIMANKYKLKNINKNY